MSEVTAGDLAGAGVVAETRESDAPAAALCYAWTLWDGWRGQPILFAHIARSVVDAVRNVTKGQPTCDITITIPGHKLKGNLLRDTEHFESPEQFMSEVTPDALRKFDLISIAVRGEQLRTHLTVARSGGGESHWLKRGVLLEIHCDSDQFDEHVPTIRDRVAAAVDRGRHWNHAEPEQGGRERGGKTYGPKPTPAEFEAERRRKLRRWRLAATAMLPLAGVYYWLVSPWFFGQGQQGMSTYRVGFGVGGILLGALPSLFVLWLFPKIEVFDVSKSGRATKMTVRGAGLAIGPAVGFLISPLGPLL